MYGGDQRIRQPLVPFLEEMHAYDDILFWRDLASAHSATLRSRHHQPARPAADPFCAKGNEPSQCASTLPD